MTTDAERSRTAPPPPPPPGVPGAAGRTGHTAPTGPSGPAEPTEPAGAPRTTGGAPGGGHTAPAHAGALRTTEALLPEGRRAELELRLQESLTTFVEDPRGAVREADAVFEEATNQLTEALVELRRSLRSSCPDQLGGTGTEELRRALQQYRDTAERLLRL
ncbi:hypothetical protein JW613_20660 [Streptomyces smyrnaeus]|uniref:Uncharacterized protein n=1 Tax=Streptomyces smyrnaeus TaxID=1387713 RepID=A0ABS3XZ71_9ACTN|nr:hypothetical protein [Streptomyces smyrnaeus]MBO8200703.1 hypothetical protein [Streptomyces smyrnaeus]